MNQKDPFEPRYLTVQQTCERGNQSRSTVYRHLKAGDIQAVKRGRTTLIDRASVERWLDSLPPLYVSKNT